MEETVQLIVVWQEEKLTEQCNSSFYFQHQRGENLKKWVHKKILRLTAFLSAKPTVALILLESIR